MSNEAIDLIIKTGEVMLGLAIPAAFTFGLYRMRRARGISFSDEAKLKREMRETNEREWNAAGFSPLSPDVYPKWLKPKTRRNR